MSFCVSCGSEMDDGWMACPKCGTAKGGQQKQVHAERMDASYMQKLQGTASNQQPISDRGIGSISHILGPLIGFLVPLIIYLIKNEETSQNDPLLSSHLKEALNASVTFSIAMIVHIVLMVVLIGLLTFLIHWILYLIWALNAHSALKAGQEYRYPFTFHFL